MMRIKRSNVLFLLVWAVTIVVLMPPWNLSYAMALLLAVSATAVVLTIRSISKPLELRVWPITLVSAAIVLDALPWLSQGLKLWDAEGRESILVALGHVVFIKNAYVQEMWITKCYITAFVAVYLGVVLPVALMLFFLYFAAKRVWRQNGASV